MSYTSDFEDNTSSSSSKRKSSWKNDEVSKKFKNTGTEHSAKRPSKSSYVDAYEKEEKKAHFAQFLSLSAYGRHKKLVHDYLNYYGGKMEDFERNSSNDKTDYDILRENHKFIWDDNDDSKDETWGRRLAKTYYDKLFKEYCICDLSRYKENKIAMRWRVEKEVVNGKGQFTCGARKCTEKDDLKSWEVNFVYKEEGEKRQALIKIRLCSECSYKLNYTKKHIEVKKKKKKEKRKSKKERKRKERKRKESSESSSSSEGDDVKEKEKEEIKEKEKEGTKEDDVWSKPQTVEVEKSKEEEFEEYLEDLFL